MSCYGRIIDVKTELECLDAGYAGALKVEYDMPSKETRNEEPFMSGRIRDYYWALVLVAPHAVDFETGDWRGNCATTSVSAG
ncbi:hypothetical protein TNCV_999211 [Trichonephila clavipes]|nr:hypothetical protein TNCV_999211 [Trichonephila clavipes]